MRVKTAIFVVTGICCGALQVQLTGAESAAELQKDPVAVTEQWLGLNDNGKYADSWQAAAAYFQGAVKKDQWTQTMMAMRTPLGAVRSRKLWAQQNTTSLPGAPDGEYVVLQYQTSFEKKESAVETVTPMRERDGTWRIAGYYIR